MTESEVALGDGASTTLQVWGDSGPLLLCVHGMASSRRSWERLGKAFTGTYRVAAYDQRGHGDAWKVTGPMSLAQGESDLRDVAASLGEPLHALVGHSWGGAVVLGAGRGGPAARVAAIDPMIRQVDGAWYEEYVAELREAFAFEGAERDARTREEFAAWSHDDAEGKVHAVHAMTARPIEGLRDDNPPASWDLRATIASYDRPLLLAFPPRGDGINEPETLDEVEARRAPTVRIAWFPGEGHNLHRTAFDAFERELRAFLA